MEENQGKKRKFFYWAGVGVTFWLTCEWRHRYLRNSLKNETVKPSTILKENEGKPVLVSGILKGNEIFEASFFNIKRNCLRLVKTVERYESGWRDDDTDAPEFLVSQERFNEEFLEIFPFKISPRYLRNLSHDFKIAPVTLTLDQRKWFKGKGFAVYRDEDFYYVSRYTRKSNIYKPTKGDFKVKFEYTPNKSYITIFGQQAGDTIKPFNHPALTHPVLLIKPGWHSIDDIIETLPLQNTLLLTISRLIGPFSILSTLYFHLTNKA